MTERSVTHATFVVERIYDATPARVFAAWADPAAKARYMRRDDTRISVSLATVELAPADAGTRLIFTEQGAFLDGRDTPDLREQGTGAPLDAPAADLARERASV